MTATLKGPWSRTQIDDFLTRTRWPLRLACNGSDGFPRVASVWFRLQGDVLECVSHRDSAVIRLLRRDPRAAFEVSPNEPPYFGVRGQVEATLQPLGDSDALDDLVMRYLGSERSRVGDWLLSRREEEMLIRLTPSRFFTWDYRERMADVKEDSGQRGN